MKVNYTPDLISRAQDAGIPFPDDWQYGKNRAPGIGKGPTNQAAWLFMHPPERITYYDYSSDTKITVWGDNEKPDRATIKKNREAQQERKRLQAKRQGAAKEHLRSVWNTETVSTTGTEYTQRKGIKPHTARWWPSGNCLIVPLHDAGGNLQSAQRIYNDGKKLTWKGTSITGAFFQIGDVHDGDLLIVCEGMATGSTIHLMDDDPLPVFCAMTCGNLLPVCKALRSVYPERYIVVYGDDDRQTAGNPGRTRAIEAALAVDDFDSEIATGWVSFPPLCKCCTCTDFNDWQQCRMRGTA